VLIGAPLTDTCGGDLPIATCTCCTVWDSFFFLPSLPVRARAARRSLLPSTDHKSDCERGENGIPEEYIVTNSRERKLVRSSAYILRSKERHIGARPCESAVRGRKKEERKRERERNRNREGQRHGANRKSENPEGYSTVGQRTQKRRDTGRSESLNRQYGQTRWSDYTVRC